MKSQKKPRRIVVDGAPFLWAVKHHHHVRASSEGTDGRCREVFTAYRAGVKHGALRISFDDGPGHHAGYPEAGVVWRPGPEMFAVNLNTPRVAAALIRAALRHGWTPTQVKTPLAIADGFELLDNLSRELALPVAPPA